MPLIALREILAPGVPRTIRFRIITLVLLVLLPLLAIFGWAAFRLASARMELIELHRAEVAREISTRANVRIANAIGKLGGLASSVEPSESAPGSLSRDARGILAEPDITRIWLFDRGGKLTTEAVLDGRSTGGIQLEPEQIRRTFAGEYVVSRLYGRDKQSAHFVVSVPILRDGKVISGLAAAISMSFLDGILSGVELSERWLAAIVDGRGAFLARSLNPERWVGQLARPELVVAAGGQPSSGAFENVTWEGEPMLNSFRRSSLTGWTAVVAVPRDLVRAPMLRSALLVVLVGAGALALTLTAAFAYARRISEPVRALGHMARAFASGQRVGKPQFALAELAEVQQALETAAAESAHLAALVASSGDAIISMTLDGTISTWNPAAEALFGYTAEEMIGKPKALLVPPDKLADYRSQQRRVSSGESLRSETIRMHKNGTPITVSVDAAPIRRPDGFIIGTSSILHDITQRIASEEHQMFLMREIAHRSKNQLAIIQAIASQTARASGTKQEFLDRFKARLQGLSASHDLLLRQDWKGAPLAELVSRQIEAFVGDRSVAVSVNGPPAMLTAAAAEAIGLAMHELATNSAKYGALSVPQGKVDVAWHRIEVETPDGNESRWELTWQERDGPRVEVPTSTGFGTQVVKRMAAMSVGGTAELDYHEAGLHWRLVFPMSAMQEIGAPTRTAAKSRPPAQAEPISPTDG